MSKHFRFTEGRLRAIPPAPDGKRDTYYDTAQPGLLLRVTPNGVKTFSVLRRVRGSSKPMRENIGTWPSVPVEGRHGARTRAAAIVAKMAAAQDPGAARRALKIELTLGELFEQYIADREKAGKRRIADIRQMWELYLGVMPDGPAKKHGRRRVKPEVGVDWSKKRLSEVTTEQISTLHSRIVAAGKAITANRVHELLRAAFGFGMRQKLITSNPADGVTPARERDRSRFLKNDELPAFEKALKAEPELWRDYFTVLLYVGYRRQAVAAMQWGDLDLNAGTWTIPGERAKNGDAIVLPVIGPALTALKRRYRKRTSSPWVFPGASAAGHLTQPKKSWARILERAKLEDLRIHDLRRTFGSMLAMSGVSLPMIGQALGHKDPRSTQVYARLQTHAVAGAVAAAHEMMRAAGRQKGRKRRTSTA